MLFRFSFNAENVYAALLLLYMSRSNTHKCTHSNVARCRMSGRKNDIESESAKAAAAQRIK